MFEKSRELKRQTHYLLEQKQIKQEIAPTTEKQRKQFLKDLKKDHQVK